MFKRFSLLAKEHYIFLSEFVQKLHPKWNNTNFIYKFTSFSKSNCGNILAVCYS